MRSPTQRAIQSAFPQSYRTGVILRYVSANIGRSAGRPRRRPRRGSDRRGANTSAAAHRRLITLSVRGRSPPRLGVVPPSASPRQASSVRRPHGCLRHHRLGSECRSRPGGVQRRPLGAGRWLLAWPRWPSSSPSAPAVSSQFPATARHPGSYRGDWRRQSRRVRAIRLRDSGSGSCWVPRPAGSTPGRSGHAAFAILAVVASSRPLRATLARPGKMRPAIISRTSRTDTARGDRCGRSRTRRGGRRYADSAGGAPSHDKERSSAPRRTSSY